MSKKKIMILLCATEKRDKSLFPYEEGRRMHQWKHRVNKTKRVRLNNF